MSNKDQKKLRIAMITGVLGKGGAEKQLFYIISSMLRLDMHVKVFSLTQGEYYENKLSDLGVECIWIGKLSFPIWRLGVLLIEIIRFKPQIMYSTHFYGNLYVGIIGKILRILSIGSIRNDAALEIKNNAFWGQWLIKTPNVLIANSNQAVNQMINLREDVKKFFILRNFIDLSEFDQLAKNKINLPIKNEKFKIILVARLVEQKRIDRFIKIMASLCKKHTNIIGLIVGDGPERERLQQTTIDLNLSQSQLFFWGHEENIPSLLNNCDLLLLTSDHEGFPNVLLEAMAARLPVITSAVGDAERIIKNGFNGYVLPKDDLSGFEEKIEFLLSSFDTRQAMGVAGRTIVEQEYEIQQIDRILLGLLIEIAEICEKKDLIEQLQNLKEDSN